MITIQKITNYISQF